jgi:hypothetical protein
MPSLELKKLSDIFAKDDPENVHLVEVRSFRGKDGRSYLVYRYPSSKSKRFSYHTFVEVQDKAACREYCGGEIDGTNPGWWDIWPEP